MTDDQIREGIRKVLDHCKRLNLQLTRLSNTHEPEGIASGFLVKVDECFYLISAGHALQKPGWVVETNLTIEDKGVTVCIPVNSPWTLKRLAATGKTLQEVDVAWAKIDIDAFKAAVKSEKGLAGKTAEFLIYQGPLEDAPNPSEPHAYAAANRGTLFPAPGGLYLERDYSYEYLMEFKGTRGDGLYVFSIPKHKGHDYYRGASGSPIIEPSGKVVAILVRGCESKNELYGYPMPGLLNLIRVSVASDL
jgi:hypothetical protein